MFKKIVNCILLIIILFSLSSCSLINFKTTEKEKEYPIKLAKLYDGKSVNIINPEVARFIKNADKTDYLAEVLSNRNDEWKNGTINRLDYQGVMIEWEDTLKDETFTVHIADNIEFNNEFTYVTKNNSVFKEIGILTPGITYYYKVVGSVSGESKVDSFIANALVRYISADTLINLRDLGGWKTTSGKEIKYGLLYRGGAPNEDPVGSYLSEDARKVFDYLKIKGEIDLRGVDTSYLEDNDEYINLNKINSTYPILREELLYFSYELMVTSSTRAENNLPKIFAFLADENNYPVFFHCSVGADRTGTLAFILESLLGVDFKYIMVDFELTSFSNLDITGGIRNRSTIKKELNEYSFDEPSEDDYYKLWYTYNKIMENYKDYSTDLSVVMEKYLIDVGVKKEHINKVKEIMLG